MSKIIKGYNYKPKTLRPTEEQLEKIYECAKLGLKGDSIPLAAGINLDQYKQLKEFNKNIEILEKRAIADNELELSKCLMEDAKTNPKTALEVLKHKHGWVAKQQLNVEIEDRISITEALKEAEKRVAPIYVVDI